MTEGIPKSILRRGVRAAGSARLGVGLIGLIVLYLSVASAAPQALSQLLGTPQRSLYAHWPIVALWVLLCVNVILATVLRVPRRAAFAGAFIAHLGLLTLSAGAVWYALGSVHGQTCSYRIDGGWSAMDRLYVDGTAGCYVAGTGSPQSAVQTPLDLTPTDGGKPRALDVSLSGAPEGVRIRATQFLPRTRLKRDPSDLAPQSDPAAGRLTPAPAGPRGDPFTGPALGVRISEGQWSLTTYLPFAPVPRDDDWERIVTPAGRVVHLAFCRASEALAGEVRVITAQYLTYPGSVVPMDYRCRVAIDTGGGTRTETISLNHPVKLGRYQIAHDTWSPTPEVPSELVFSVSSRPGLPLVWTGAVGIVVGMLYAFYVKPLIQRRKGGPG